MFDGKVTEQRRTFRPDGFEQCRSNTTHFRIANDRASNLEKMPQGTGIDCRNDYGLAGIGKDTAGRGTDGPKLFSARLGQMRRRWRAEFGNDIAVRRPRILHCVIPHLGDSGNMIDPRWLYKLDITFV